MSQATTAPNPDERMLARLAELDLAAAEKAHAKLMAAEETAEVVELSRAYQRVARSLRQTLALKAKLAEARAAAAAVAAGRHDPQAGVDLHAFRVDDRTLALQDAVDRVVEAAEPDDVGRRDALAERFDAELDDWMMEDDFCRADLDTQVLRACRLLGLPQALGQRWRALPPATFAFSLEPEDAPREPAAEPPPPRSGSG